jgi:hypothetical protein
MELEKKFNQVIDIGYNVQERTNEKKMEIDGRKVWGEIEKLVKDIDVKSLNLKYQDNNKFYNDIDSLNIKSENEFNPKYNHFLLQLKNLVLTKSIDRIIESHRLFQIAYNLGQLKYNYENNILPEDMKKVIDNNMDIFSIRKFIDDKTINKLNEFYKNINIDVNDFIIDINQTGGFNYYHKYLKYKLKYLSLKLN